MSIWLQNLFKTGQTGYIYVTNKFYKNKLINGRDFIFYI